MKIHYSPIISEALQASNELLSSIELTRQSSDERDSFDAILCQFDKMKFQQLMDDFEAERIDNFQFRFLRNYMNMLMTLLKFIYANRLRDWVLYLSSLKELLLGIIAMDFSSLV